MRMTFGLEQVVAVEANKDKIDPSGPRARGGARRAGGARRGATLLSFSGPSFFAFPAIHSCDLFVDDEAHQNGIVKMSMTWQVEVFCEPSLSFLRASPP